MEMVAIRAQDRPTVDLEDLPENFEEQASQSPLLSAADVLSSESGRLGSFKDLVSKFEHELMQRTLAETKGNRSRAAEHLGLKRTTMVVKLTKFELEEPLTAYV